MSYAASCAPSGRALPDARFCTLARTSSGLGEYLQVIWQIVAKNQARRLARVLFQVPEVAAVLGVPHSPRDG